MQTDPQATSAAHRPLSQTISDFLREDGLGPLTLNRLLDRTQGRGVHLVVIVLCLPFVVPVSLPGLSTVMGSIVGLLALGIVFGKRVRFPSFMGERVFPPAVQQRVLGGSIAFLRRLERFVRPRRTGWLSWRPTEVFNALLLVLLATLLALPLPSPPFFFSNFFPGCAIILLAAGMMEQDGWFIWVGYAAALANVFFFALIGKGVVELFMKLWHKLSQAGGLS
jgi:hypothetical protein